MVTVTRPPFWVPRPSDDFIWNAAPLHSAAIQALTAQKFFGAGGQVPTKRWQPYYNYNVAESQWNIPPQGSWLLRNLTQQKINGAGGQVPTKRWLPYLTYDVAESQWNAAPIDSPIIAYLTKQKVFGAGGQVPTKGWLPYYTENDPPPWQTPTEWMNSGILQQLGRITFPLFTPYLWRLQYTQNDPPPWQQPTQRNAPLNVPTGTPTVPVFWNVSPVDDPPWSWQWWVPINLNPVPIEFISNARVRWNFYDDPSPWQASFVSNPAIFSASPPPPPPSTAVSRGPFYVPRPPVDDPWGWQKTFNQVVNITFTPPFSSRPASFYSEDTAWTGTPLRSNLLDILSVGGQVKPFRWNWGLDDPPSWQQPKGFNLTLNTGVANPFTSRPPVWYSEDAFWSPRLVRPNTLSLLTAGGIRKAKLWRWDFDVGESFWQGAPVGYVIDLPVTGKPKTLPWFSYWAHANFDIDAPGWVGAPRNAANTVNPIPPPPVRRFTPMIMRLGRLSHSIRR